MCENTFINYLYYIPIENDKVDYTSYRKLREKYNTIPSVRESSFLFQQRIKEGMNLDELKQALKEIGEESKTIEKNMFVFNF